MFKIVCFLTAIVILKGYSYQQACDQNVNRCYTIHNDKKSWQQARDYCQSNESGDLAYFVSPAEQTKVHVGNQSLWIGLKKNVSGIWEWTNGEEISYNSFINIKNVDPDAVCAAVVNGSYWQKFTCDTVLGFICVNISNVPTLSGDVTAVVDVKDVTIGDVSDISSRTTPSMSTETTLHDEISSTTLSSTGSSLSSTTKNINVGRSNHLIAKYQMCKSVNDSAKQNICLQRLVRESKFVANVLNDAYRQKLQHQVLKHGPVRLKVIAKQLLEMYIDLLDVTLLADILPASYEHHIKNFFDFFLNMESLVLDLTKDLHESSPISLMFTKTSFRMDALKSMRISSPMASSHVEISSETSHSLKFVHVTLMDLNFTTVFSQRDVTGMEYTYDGRYFVISPILSINVIDSNLTTKEVQFTLTYSREKEQIVFDNRTSRQKILCGFISKSRKWSTDGCYAVEITSIRTKCRCNHTTNFAILMQITEFKIAEVHEMALNIITYIGCSVSLLTQFITVTVFTCVGTLNSERVYVHRNLCIAIIAAQIAFLSGIKVVQIKILCSIIAFILHYFYTAVFVWMLVEGLHLYSKVVQVFGTEKSRVVYYCGFGWGVPLILVTISATTDWRGYGTPTSCWLSTKDGTIWAFVGPAVAIILVNMVILWMVIRIILKLEKNSDYEQIKAGVRGALFLLPLLGLTWIFGLMAVNEDLIIFQYLFAVFNSLQGFFIFLFHCVGNSEVRQALQRMREKRVLQRSSLASTGNTGDDSNEKIPTRKMLYKRNTVSSKLSSSQETSRSTSSKSSADVVIEDLSSGEDDLALMYI